MYMARAKAEPVLRVERARLKEERRKADAAQRWARLTATYGEDAAKHIIEGRPWQGATEAMILDTLGKPEKVEEKVLKTKTKRLLYYVDECPKCSGSGFLPEFTHIASGKCFTCGGKGQSKGFSLRVVVENGAVVGWDKK
jgi:hypothetical protein